MVYYTSWWKRIDNNRYKNIKTNEEKSFSELPIAACFASDLEFPRGYDGKTIACKLPSERLWYIDSRASNCSMPDDYEHRCWVRHGTIGDKLTIDKSGKTCNAGAGSIIDRDHNGVIIFHGSLINGVLK